MDSNYGSLLIGNNIKLHRLWFKQMCQLIGVKVIHKAPRKSKNYTNYGEIEGNYEQPVATWCIFEEHPDQQTMKKLGWNSELVGEALIIHVPYDLCGLQQGSLFIVPSGIDNTKGRVFQVVKMTTSIIYPASITCQIVPYYTDEFTRVDFNHSQHNFSLLNGEDDDEPKLESSED